MKHEPLDDLLNLLRREEPPVSPPDLEENVFRAIRQRQTQVAPDGVSVKELLGTIWRPGFAAAVLALTVLTSTAATAIAVEFSVRLQARSDVPAWASEALDIQVLKHPDHILACCRPSSNT